MSLYDFRLRFHLHEDYRIDSDLEEIELLVLSSGEKIRIRSGVTGTPIKDHTQVLVVGGSFVSEEAARDAADRSKRALLYLALDQRIGIDFGDGRIRSFVTKAGLAMLQKQFGCPVRNEIHGIDIYEHAENLKFVSTDAKATVGKHAPRLVDIFRHEYLQSHHFTEKQLLASEIYTSSFFDVSPRSRFITLVTAIEALLDPLKRPEGVESLVEEYKVKAKQLKIADSERNSIINGLDRLKYQSIGQAGRTLTRRLIPNEIFNGYKSVDFFTRSYDLRSQLLHDGKIADSRVDILQFANAMASFVPQLLIASLNNDTSQDSTVEA